MSNPHNVDEKIKVVPFNPEWKKLYQSEAARIEKQLTNKIIDIQHIGSTAIANIYSKPIIDIMIGVENLAHSKFVVQKLIELGYEYFGEANIPGRLYFRKRNKHNYNIALCRYQSEIWNDNILFRDYLQKHSDIAKTYGTLKKQAYDSGINTLLKYSDVKHPFVDEIVKKAKMEQIRKRE